MKDNNIKSKKDDDSKKSNKEIIEVKSMEEFIELVNRPIVIENNTLGTLELRPSFDDYLNYLSLGSKVMWEDDRIYFPLEMGDKTAIIDNQKVSKVRFENLTSMYKDGMEFVVAKIDPKLQGPTVRKVMKEI